MKTIGIIPARYASTRFPGKPLVDINGKTMIRRVYEQCVKTPELDEVLVATDDQRIHDHVLSFGGRSVMTREEHPSGTDRCAEALQLAGAGFDIAVNIQGDEPFIDPAQISAVIQPFIQQPDTQIATLVRSITAPEDIGNPNMVKVVFDQLNQALYFSRSPIPYDRNRKPGEWPANGQYYHHIGLYAFRQSVLLALTKLPPGRLEKIESLEQLRWLEAGWKIHVSLTDLESRGIDTPEDLERVIG